MGLSRGPLISQVAKRIARPCDWTGRGAVLPGELPAVAADQVASRHRYGSCSYYR